MMLAVNQVLLIFKTNINTKEKVESIRSLMDNNPFVDCWSVDLLDVDCVLRIEANESLTELEVQSRLLAEGFDISPLDY
ncbi:hypothetical protein [Wenyingzhuangia sp. IMCC45574]